MTINTVAINFGEHDPKKIASELDRVRQATSNFVFSILDKAPSVKYEINIKSYWGPFKVFYWVHRYRVYGSRKGKGTFIGIETHVGKTRYCDADIHVWELIEMYPSLSMSDIVNEIKTQALELMEEQTDKICDHTKHLDDNRTYEEIIATLSDELKFLEVV